MACSGVSRRQERPAFAQVKSRLRLKPILKPTGRESMRLRASKRARVDLKSDLGPLHATTKFESPLPHLPLHRGARTRIVSSIPSSSVRRDAPKCRVLHPGCCTRCCTNCSLLLHHGRPVSGPVGNRASTPRSRTSTPAECAAPALELLLANGLLIKRLPPPRRGIAVTREWVSNGCQTTTMAVPE
jgi:hypothetical protein